jgi:hypothetical protein
MFDRPNGRALALVAFGLLLVSSACGVVPTTQQGDASAPILVNGRVVDADRAPIPNGVVRLFVTSDAATSEADLFDETYAANADGSFEIRLAPTPALVAFAAGHDGYVHFQLMPVGVPASHPLVFRRKLGSGTWLEDVVTVELQPLQVR